MPFARIEEGKHSGVLPFAFIAGFPGWPNESRVSLIINQNYGCYNPEIPGLSWIKIVYFYRLNGQFRWKKLNPHPL